MSKDDEAQVAVSHYEELKQQLEGFTQDNYDVMEEYRSIVDRLNDARSNADRAVRASGDSYGDFSKLSTTVKVDAMQGILSSLANFLYL